MPRHMACWPIALSLVLLTMMSQAVHAADNPLFGHWEITDAAIAPWVKAKPAEPGAETRKLLRMRMTFAAKTMKSRYRTLDCRDAAFDIKPIPPEGLFQGGLPESDQTKVAKDLGFPAGDVPSVEVNCATGSFPFHFKDKDTVSFALNNVIYTLKRR